VAPRYLLAALLFGVTFITTTILGAGYYLSTRTDVIVDLPLWLHPTTVRAVLQDPRLLRIGLSFSLPTLFILFCHEMGHYLACRRYRLPATLPYFLPAPIGLGTFGAFIRIRGPILSKRQLLDVGVAGPLAGFVALLPFLAWGIAHSLPVQVTTASDTDNAAMLLFLPGKSLLWLGLTRLFHGALPPGTVLDPHPFAIAGWVGLFATMLNLLPLGQLDGGHILYAATGRWQRWLAYPLWAALAFAGLAWEGWFLWCVVTLIMRLRHPPVWDEAEPLDARRRWLVLAAAAVFALSFMPVPISIVGIAP